MRHRDQTNPVRSKPKPEPDDCTCSLIPGVHKAAWHDQFTTAGQCSICHLSNGKHKLDCPNGR